MDLPLGTGRRLVKGVSQVTRTSASVTQKAEKPVQGHRKRQNRIPVCVCVAARVGVTEGWHSFWGGLSQHLLTLQVGRRVLLSNLNIAFLPQQRFCLGFFVFLVLFFSF